MPDQCLSVPDYLWPFGMPSQVHVCSTSSNFHRLNLHPDLVLYPAVRARVTDSCALLTRSTGWIVHWGEAMVNTDTAALVDHTRQILAVFRNTGSLSLYVAHGGTNYGFWAGASVTVAFATV